MRKIKDAKDLDTGELIYFRSHAKSVYMSNGKNLEDTILDKNLTISDANVQAVDTDDFVEEPDLAKYLTTKPQSFTDEEKQQVKDNLGISAEDFDLSDYAKKITVVDHGTEDVEIEIGPNVLHKWGEVAALTITLAVPENQTEYNEYMFEFLSGATATTLSLPDTVDWVEKPSIEPNYIYQISIVNNVGVFISAYNL